MRIMRRYDIRVTGRCIQGKISLGSCMYQYEFDVLDGIDLNSLEIELTEQDNHLDGQPVFRQYYEFETINKNDVKQTLRNFNGLLFAGIRKAVKNAKIPKPQK